MKPTGDFVDETPTFRETLDQLMDLSRRMDWTNEPDKLLPEVRTV